MIVKEILAKSASLGFISLSARLDLELLLTKALNQTRVFLYKNLNYELVLEEVKVFNKLYERYLTGEPIAYLIGKKEFWSQELLVNQDVLIPRPETELLVETVLQKMDSKPATVIDLGTGSGAIALALSSERPEWRIIASDISYDALKVAKYNAAKLKRSNIEFYQSNWGAEIPLAAFDLVVSNPPYIATGDQHLQQPALNFEPKIALEAGADGLEAIRVIVDQAKKLLKIGGLLLLEHGYDQGDKVRNILKQQHYQNIISFKDLAGIERAVLAENAIN